MFFLTRAPRTQRELSELVGCKLETVSGVIYLLLEEGLIRPGQKRAVTTSAGKRARSASTFEWVPLEPQIKETA